jgi:Ca2+-binding EF-hand superfamily protein
MEELATIVQSLDRRPTKEEIQDMICDVDLDGNGTLDFEEFLNIMGRKQKVIKNIKIILLVHHEKCIIDNVNKYNFCLKIY